MSVPPFSQVGSDKISHRKNLRSIGKETLEKISVHLWLPNTRIQGNTSNGKLVLSKIKGLPILYTISSTYQLNPILPFKSTKSSKSLDAKKVKKDAHLIRAPNKDINLSSTTLKRWNQKEKNRTAADQKSSFRNLLDSVESTLIGMGLLEPREITAVFSLFLGTSRWTQ